ncbi:MAG: DUF1302 domain-containing protein [Rhodocyclales bacterium]|nr:DUF1302 domain-containing protein [Rhodocyclales bacterium]
MNKDSKTVRRPRTAIRQSVLVLAASLCASLWSANAHAFRFGSEDGLSGSFDSVLSVGAIRRMSSPDARVIGNDNGGRIPTPSTSPSELHRKINLPGNPGGYANADFNYMNFDDGNLNYKRGDIVSMVLKGTHELSLKAPDGWSSLVRATWFEDSKIDNTRRTELSAEGKDYATGKVTLLDAWVSKEFSLGEKRAKLKLGNQVLSWGEEIFILGGVNQINALDIQKYHVPGTQVKEIFIPAPMLSMSAGLTDDSSLEAYYQFRWNGFKFDPAGTFFSTADVIGRGKRTAFYPTSICNDFGLGPTPCGETTDPAVEAQRIAEFTALPFAGDRKAKNSGQYGLAYRQSLPEIDSEIAFYYQRYHDKLPFLGFKASAGLPTSYFWAYGEDKDLFGVSMNSKVGPVAVGAELSYRPRDSVGIDPTVPFAGRHSVGAASLASPTGTAENPGFVEEKKWQFHLTGFYTFSRNDALGWLAKSLGASDGFILAEAAVTRYPKLDRSGATPYFLPDYSLPTRTSWGYVAEIALNYPNAFDSGITVTPQVDWFHDVKGTSPNTIPFVEGRKAASYSLFFNYRDKWKAGLQRVVFFGGGANNLMRDRDFLGANISYAF